MNDDASPQPKGENANEQPQNAGAGNRRPEQVATLLFEGETHDTWYGANRTANRFFLLNVKKVAGDLNLEHTKAEPHFKEAERIIAHETGWTEQYPFTFESSKTQIYPDKIDAAKDFARAATIIVAMEVCAARNGGKLNVYDYLRIIPAQYFVDRLTKERFEALEGHYNRMTADEKGVFGEDAALPFNALCLKATGQEFSDRLIPQMYSGYTVTRFVADKLTELISKNFPDELHIGPVRSAGEDGVIVSSLGVKRAAPDLRVPKIRQPNELPVCR